MCATGGHRLRFRVALYSIPGCIWRGTLSTCRNPGDRAPRQLAESNAMTQDYLRPCLTNAGSCLQAARVLRKPPSWGLWARGVRDEGVRRDSWRHPDGRTYGCRFAVVPAPRHSHCGCCVSRWGRNCRVGAARAGHRAWRHNRDEHSVVGELLAHCDRHLGTATGPPPPPPRRHRHRRNPPRRNPQRRHPSRAATPAWEPPEVVPPPPPPPPPPPQLVLRYDDPMTAAFVSIANNQTSLRWVACKGPLRWRVSPPASTTTRTIISP